MRTLAPGRDVLLFDGDCPLCRSAAARLLRLVPSGKVEARSFRGGELERFPGLDASRCERALQLVRDDGEIFEGVAAVVEALRHRRRLGVAARAYFLPGIRWVADRGYAWIARNRFRLSGRSDCEESSCATHARS